MRVEHGALVDEVRPGAVVTKPGALLPQDALAGGVDVDVDEAVVCHWLADVKRQGFHGIAIGWLEAISVLRHGRVGR